MTDSKDKENSSDSKARDAVSQKLLNKKEGFLQAEHLIDKTVILGTMKAIFMQHADISVLVKSIDRDAYLKNILDKVLTPFLIERLSVFAEHYPGVFERQVFSGWMSGLIASQLGLDKDSISHAVAAAMSRDIGLLYLPPILLDETAKFGAPEWNAMKTHTLVGEIVTKDIGGLSPEITKAVVEHHERFDGLGYPKGLKGKELSILGQIVGAVDTITAIRFKRFEHSGRNLRDVYAYVQMNETQFNPEIIGVLFKMLVKTGIEKSLVNPFKTIDKLVSHLYVRAAAMNGVIHLMQKLDDALVFFDSGPKRKELQKINIQVSKLIAQSGVLDKEMLDWLNSMDHNYDYRQVDLSELSEIELLQNELYWHLKRVSDACQIFHDLEMNKGNPSAQVVTTVLRCLNEKNLPRAAESIPKNR